ncbi:hypothetical protein [Haloarcula sp. CBA1129]|uniref:hypothetical protein n=1 Tax=Haloarcula sp. CBA1129 TaxID=1853684 RepID=UPI0012470142|nr:hypothetical protein [Haloarcula sp. CBA1129]KAA9399675.1 hypothetical protein Har1129_16195 [Haloarcula sp. CBA1129]
MSLMERLDNASRQPGHITPDEMETAVNSQGQRSRIGRYRATTAHMLREGRSNPLKLAIPAYESFATNATADDTETFNLGHSVTDSPVTQAVVVWLDGEYYGTPDSVDYDADTIDVTDTGTESTVHVYYISDAAASLEIRKAASNADTGSQRVYTGNLGLVHNAPQIEQPEYLRLTQTPLHNWVGTDMTVDVYLDAPYTVRWTDNDGDGTEPTNALLHVPAMVGQSEINGLTSAVSADMGRQ